ncbi:G-protein coupled receptor moody-like [Saccostrea echinata]|uniref:G-protein coupled receptor moody-like n=1 Tax=Saccostrea echinata TaxID=191078 RepID=UPI002A7EAC41|nr:G-protein coupled receptor moody-like [Saccostrea echinata]
MSSSIVSSFGGSFFQWFQDEVLPYLLGTVIVIVIIVALILNILLIITLRKRNMLRFPCNRFVLELSVMDLIAVFLILFPSMVAAFAKAWYLTDYFCYVHAGLIIWFHLVTFGLLSVMFVERMVKITNTDLYVKVFNSSRVVTLISALVWTFTALITGVALTPWLTISYNFYHAACVINLDDNIYYTIIVLMFGMVASIIICIVTVVKIFKHKKQAAAQEANVKKNSVTSIKEEPGEKAKLNGGGKGFGSLLSQTKAKNSRSNEAPGKSMSTTGIGASTNGEGKPPRNKLALMAARKKIKKAVTKTKVTKIFSLKEDNGDPDLHMFVTYLIVWVAMLVCHCPYFAINIADFADSGDIWGGYYSITVIFFMVSYCTKPIIYLAHNRKYREGYKETMPEKVIEKANTARKSVSNFMDKLDKAMFKTPGKKKLDATLSTHMAANKWLRKVKNKNGTGGATGGLLSKLKPKTEEGKTDAGPSKTTQKAVVEPLPKNMPSSPTNTIQSAITARDVNLVEKAPTPAAAALPTAVVFNETAGNSRQKESSFAADPVPENDFLAESPPYMPTDNNYNLTKQNQWRRIGRMAHVFDIDDVDEVDHSLDMV